MFIVFLRLRLLQRPAGRGVCCTTDTRGERQVERWCSERHTGSERPERAGRQAVERGGGETDEKCRWHVAGRGVSGEKQAVW